MTHVIGMFWDLLGNFIYVCYSIIGYVIFGLLESIGNVVIYVAGGFYNAVKGFIWSMAEVLFYYMVKLITAVVIGIGMSIEYVKDKIGIEFGVQMQRSAMFLNLNSL